MFNFGGKGNKRGDTTSSVMTPENPPIDAAGGGTNSVTGFDSAGLERAAKAARELDASRNAPAAIDLIKTQEATKQHEAAARRAQNDAYVEQTRTQNIQLEAEEARKTLDAQTQHNRYRVEYQDELERKRQVDMLNAQKYMQEEQLKKQEEMVARQEAMRRKTAEREAELRARSELAKARAEADGRIRQERENHDLILEKVRLEATEYRDTLLKAVTDGGRLVGAGLSSYLDDTDKLRNTALVVTAAAVGVYTARTFAGVAGRFVEARLGKPSLVRETSRLGATAWVRQPWSTGRRWWASYNSTTADALSGLVLPESLTTRLSRVALATANTKRNRAPFRHLLLHGPPGTGKTMFAKGLARHSGLEYAVLTGGDVAPLGREAVTEIHKLFDWSKTSRKGLLLFVDEADAFLQSREKKGHTISEDQRNALNAFLYRTGTESNEFMMVYASNQPAQFDSAIMDRIDEMISFDLPGESERRRMIAQYVDRYLLRPATGSQTVTTVDIGDDEIERVVQQTVGFSGRAISKLAIAWQAAAYGTEGAVLNQETFFDTVRLHKASMKTKEQWRREQLFGDSIGGGEHKVLDVGEAEKLTTDR